MCYFQRVTVKSGRGKNFVVILLMGSDHIRSDAAKRSPQKMNLIKVSEFQLEFLRLTAMQKTPQASRNVLSQSTGGPGLSSRATVAPADVAHAQVVSERAATGAGGPGISSGLTTTVPCPADAKRLFSPLDSPAVHGSCDPTTTTSDPSTSPLFTVASDDIGRRMEKLMLESKLQFRSSRTSITAKMEQYSWYTPDDDAWFLRAPEDPEEDIFIRPSYVDLYKILDNMWQGRKYRPRGKSNCALITGTPGIGKSVFGRVLIKWILERPKPVLIFYKPIRSPETEIFWQGKHFPMKEADAFAFLREICDHGGDLVSRHSYNEDNIEIWSISDAQTPLENRFIKQVCITSPRRSSSGSGEIKSWVNDNKATTLVLPPCEWDEMRNIRSSMWGESAEQERPLATLEKEFKFWGGIPRTLIEYESEHLKTLIAKFRQLKIADALPFLGTYNLDYVEHSEAFFHLRPRSHFKDEEEGSTEAEKLKRKYMFPVHCWATEQMSMEAWNQFQQEQDADVINYIDTLNTEPTARGKWFEQEVHGSCWNFGRTSES